MIRILRKNFHGSFRYHIQTKDFFSRAFHTMHEVHETINSNGMLVHISESSRQFFKNNPDEFSLVMCYNDIFEAKKNART